MSKCMYCKRDVLEVAPDEGLRSGYVAQADVLGMESLTETQQMLVNGTLCEECYFNQS